jgi:hypothetical protein
MVKYDVPCKFGAECKYGARCQYRHDVVDDRNERRLSIESTGSSVDSGVVVDDWLDGDHVGVQICQKLLMDED